MTIAEAKTKIELEKLDREAINAMQDTMPHCEWNQLRIAINDIEQTKNNKDICELKRLAKQSKEMLELILDIAVKIAAVADNVNANKLYEIIKKVKEIKDASG